MLPLLKTVNKLVAPENSSMTFPTPFCTMDNNVPEVEAVRSPA